MENIILKPIGFIHSTRKEMTDDNWDEETVWIELDKNEFSPDALAGLETFSHAEIVFYMDKVAPEKIEKTARHPRNNEDWPKVGIFSQRGKNRPNQIGITICEVLKIEGGNLYLRGLDGINGTPVLDIKPWVKEFGPRGQVKQPNWITELMEGYWRK
ncbi:MAG: SAM-dependent methyltransferase [Bdellovibrionales bacterium]|nr:SAM-dependent methyltransferase [Bdellovibrionales bacterium]